MGTKKVKTVILGDEAKKFFESHKELGNNFPKAMVGIKGYFKVGKRDYTAFRVNDNGILRIHENLQHEGDCRSKLKLHKLL